MRKIALLTAILTTTSAFAQSEFTDNAQVLSAVPAYQTVNSQNCQMVQTQPQASSGGIGYTGAILGALAGGLLGNTVGGGNGRIAAAAIGATGGALAGSSVENGMTQQPQEQQVCTPVQSQQLIGYTVTYSYAGRTGTVLSHNQPGQTIPVSITPAVY